MELPQPKPKPFGIEGRKTTHDFLSLYSATHQDQRSTQGGYLQTHDFLQPLDQVGKNGRTKEEDVHEVKDVGKPPPRAVPLPSVEHLLPGGIGTYSITNFNQRIPISKPPDANVYMMAAQANSNSRNNDENSNSSSYSGNVFTLWDESAVNKGKTGKENEAGNKGSALREAGVNQGGGQWTTSMERTSNPSSNHNQNYTTFSSPTSSQPSSVNRNQTFMDMITSGKSNQEEDEEEEEEFIIKNEPSSYSRGNLSIKVDAKSPGQKPNTPRSKHSATEQRRRSKINDRFQKLREIIPHGDQKRDKASFLLEVIEYIQYLQEKVHKYDGAYQGWNHEPTKILPRINHRTAGDFTNQTQSTNAGLPGPTVLLGSKYDETKTGKSASPPINGHPVVDLDMTCATNLVTKVESALQQQRPNSFSSVGPSSIPLSFSSTPGCDVDKMACHQQNSQIWSGTTSAITDKLKDQELSIESGTISISSRYSQGLLNTLTQALQSSGVDLSEASISVQIDLGKKGNADVNTSPSIIKDIEIPKKNQAMPTTSSSMKCKVDESSQAMKRLKTSRS